MSHSADISGYIFRAELFTPYGLGRELYKLQDTAYDDTGYPDKRAAWADLNQAWRLFHGNTRDNLEPFLDSWAAFIELDRNDEYSFESDDFPKIVFANEWREIESTQERQTESETY